MINDGINNMQILSTMRDFIVILEIHDITFERKLYRNGIRVLALNEGKMHLKWKSILN